VVVDASELELHSSVLIVRAFWFPNEHAFHGSKLGAVMALTGEFVAYSHRYLV